VVMTRICAACTESGWYENNSFPVRMWWWWGGGDRGGLGKSRYEREGCDCKLLAKGGAHGGSDVMGSDVLGRGRI
jgi:hypothetical protein